MTKLSRLSTDNDDITVHAVGPGYGESIVLIIGGRLVLGIDCCLALIQPTAEGPSCLEQILAQCAKNAHIIWLITHFHFDHFQSFTKLLELIGSRIGSLVIPDEYTSANLHQLARDAKSDEGEQTIPLATDELSRLLVRLRTMPLASRVTYFGGKGPHRLLEIELEIRHRGKTRKVPVSVEVFAPRYDVRHGILKTAWKQMLAGVEKRAAANHTSYIVRVRAGRFESLLLGDSPAIRTAQCAIASDPKSEVFLLKVAHHGARDGTNKSLLKKLRVRAPQRIAVICPFKVHKLPTDVVLDLLHKSGFEIRRPGSISQSLDLKKRIMEQSDLGLIEASLEAYEHKASITTIESHL